MPSIFDNPSAMQLSAPGRLELFRRYMGKVTSNPKYGTLTPEARLQLHRRLREGASRWQLTEDEINPFFPQEVGEEPLTSPNFASDVLTGIGQAAAPFAAAGARLLGAPLYNTLGETPITQAVVPRAQEILAQEPTSLYETPELIQSLGAPEEFSPGQLVGRLGAGLVPYWLVGKGVGALPGAGRAASAAKGASTFGIVEALGEFGLTGTVDPKNLARSLASGSLFGGIASPVQRALALALFTRGTGGSEWEAATQALFAAISGRAKFSPRTAVDTGTAHVVREPTTPVQVVVPKVVNGEPNPAVNLVGDVVNRPPETPPTVGPAVVNVPSLNRTPDPPLEARLDATKKATFNEEAFRERARELREQKGLNIETAVNIAEQEFALLPVEGGRLEATTASGLRDVLKASLAREKYGEAEALERAGQDPLPKIQEAQAVLDAPPPQITSPEMTTRAIRELFRGTQSRRELMKLRQENPKWMKNPANRRAFQEALEDLSLPLEAPVPRRKSAELTDLRERAAQQGLRLDVSPEGRINLHGREYNSLLETQRALESYERGRTNPAEMVTQPPELIDKIAAEKGVEIVPVEDGKFIVRDNVEGTQVETRSYPEAVEVVAKAPSAQESAIGPDFGRPTGTPPPAAPTAEAPPAAYHAESRSWDVRNPATLAAAEWVQIKKDLLASIEEKSGIPVFEKVWEPMEDARMQNVSWLNQERKSLAKIFKGVNSKSDHEALQIWATSPAELRAGVEARYRMSPKLRAKASAYESWLREVLTAQYNAPVITEYILRDLAPRARRGDFDLRSGVDLHLSTAPMRVLRDAVLDGELRLSGKHAGEFATQILHAIGREKFIEKPYNKAVAFLEALNQELRGTPTQQTEYIKVATRVARDYLDAARNRPDAVMSGADKAVAQIFKNLGLPIEGPIVGKVLNTLQYAYYGGTIGARPALAIRNLAQATFPLVKVWNAKEYALALKDALKPETRVALRRKGLIGESSDIYQSEVTIGLGTLRRLNDAGLYLYRNVDDFTRAIAYSYGKRLVNRYGADYLAGRISRAKFERETGMELDYDPARESVLRHLDNTDSPSLELAADRYGLQMSQDTQWIYSSSNAPRLFKGVAGKAFGQFGIWPANFISAVNRYTNPLGGTVSAAARARVVARYTALYSAFAALQGFTGIETSDYLGGNPLTFSGGPMFQSVLALRDALLSNDPRTRQIAAAKIKRMATNFIPGNLALRDIIDAGEETDQAWTILRALGFEPAEGK